MWIPTLKLNIEHKNILQQKLWLDDTIINSAQKLLSHQFPENDGLQSTLVVAAKKCTLGGGAIQIMYVRTNHWLCIRVSQDKAVINIYDSMYASPIMTTVDLILEVIKSEQDTVTINSIKMQEQAGCNACGVFAIAVATALCHNNNPTTIKWKQNLMWQHTLECLEAGKMTPFSMENSEDKGFIEDKASIKSTKTYELYCICRQQYKPMDTMKHCTSCFKWYHTNSLGIPSYSLRKYDAWHCSYCM